MNNSVKKLADNPHYTMNEHEIEELANVLAAEAESEKKQEEKSVPKVKLNKNRVKKDFVKLEKTPALDEEDEDGPAR